MIKLGLDFDNTLIDYDEVFYKIAFQKGLIPKSIDRNKASVRTYLVNKNREEEFKPDGEKRCQVARERVDALHFLRHHRDGVPAVRHSVVLIRRWYVVEDVSGRYDYGR